MLVNSVPFWIFFLAVAIPYFWFLRKSAKAQNIWLLIASYFFYGYVEIKMIPVMLIATVIFYLLGIQIEKENQRNAKKASMLTTIGVVLGVGLLVYFKYLNFLIEELASLFESMGLQTNMSTFRILAPLGISYFTFKLISYVLEVHREKMEASHDPIAFGTFVAFFPTIMAGPIDRPNEFLPQLKGNRLFNYDEIAEGLKRILWGMFQKMCIADVLSGYVDAVYGNYMHHNASTILLASVFYFFQLYTDFCGYSNMAIGVSQILGVRIRENFNRPLFAQNNIEYWRRWHMSLTTWLTDYVFIPLNIKFRELGVWGLYLATLINMVLVGAWHGSNWTFVVFGLYHGVLLCIATYLEKPRKKFEKKHNLKKKFYWIYPRMLFTWMLFMVGAVIFRAESMTDFCSMMNNAFVTGFGTLFRESLPRMALISMVFMLFKEWKDENRFNISFLHSKFYAVRIASFALLIVYIMLFGSLYGSTFIYYQF